MKRLLRKIKRHFLLLVFGIVSPSAAAMGLYSEKEIKYIREKCERCTYFGRASDAPKTVDKDCMWVPTEDEEERPCEKNLK